MNSTALTNKKPAQKPAQKPLQRPLQKPPQTLADRIVSLYSSINLANAQLLALIAEFDEHSFGARQGFISTAHWLNYHCGIGMTAAREKVRVARALQNLPVVAACFSEGRVSYSKVRALTRVATVENEAALLDIARHATAAQAERIFRQYRQTLDSAEASTVGGARNEQRSEFSSHWDEEGYLVFRGRLAPEQGALVLAALQREQDEGAERSGALAEVSRRALSADTSESSQAPARAVSSADRYQIHVELDGTTAHLRDGPGIADKLVERLSCDASIIPHRCDSEGEPLDVGRKTRTIPPALRRALTKRDGGCRFPGCTHRRFVDAHHVQHWAHGGATKLSNLVLLCTRHHTAVHEEGFRIEVIKPAIGSVQFKFYDSVGEYLPPVADDLSGGVVLKLHPDANIDASAEARHPSVRRSPLKPLNPTRRPDYSHINWVLTNFHPPNRL